MSLAPQVFKEAYGKVPFPIREYLISDELPETVQEIGSSFGLHIDREGEFVDVMTEMLLGFITPEDLPRELLRRIGVPDSQSSAVIAAVNAKIFKPLQARVKEDALKPRETPIEAYGGARAVHTSSTPEPLQTPSLTPSQQVSQNIPTPLIPPPSLKPVQQIPLTPPAQAPPSPAPIPATPAPIPLQTPPPAPLPIHEVSSVPTSPISELSLPIQSGNRTMASDMALARGDRSTINPFAGISHVPAPEPEPPFVLPPQSASSIPSPTQPSETPFRAPPGNLPGTPTAPIIKSYGTDPYREPIQ